MQSVIIEGYLAADPSILTAQGSGKKRASFRVLETVRFRRGDGQVGERTTGFNCVCFNERTAEDYIAAYAHKGARVVVSGRVENDTWTGRDGTAHYDLRLIVEGLRIKSRPASRSGPGADGSDTWSALTRGRLRHLEALGLATRQGRRYRLDSDLEQQLRALQIRRDIIRTLHERRLEARREVRELGAGSVRGRVVRNGHHDELGASGWAIVRDRDNVEHFARLRSAQPLPKVGREVDLTPAPGGARVTDLGRGQGLQR